MPHRRMADLFSGLGVKFKGQIDVNAREAFKLHSILQATSTKADDCLLKLGHLGSRRLALDPAQTERPARGPLPPISFPRCKRR